MNRLISILFICFFVLPTNVGAKNQDWYFPIQNYQNRSQYKTFNQYWDKNSYKGKEALFPTQFTGYHVADDLEINPGEKNQNVPVYAISAGKITFAGPVNGYGGLILLDIANDSHTALYGHIKLSSLKVKTGATVKAGQELAYLGDGYSNETGGERKHLHFGIYNGKSVYYRGYESSEAAVQNRWIDPAAYLKQKEAADISEQSGSNHSSAKNENQNTTIDNVNADNNTSQSGIPKQPVEQNITDKTENKRFASSILLYLERIISKIRSAI